MLAVADVAAVIWTVVAAASTLGSTDFRDNFEPQRVKNPFAVVSDEDKAEGDSDEGRRTAAAEERERTLDAEDEQPDDANAVVVEENRNEDEEGTRGSTSKRRKQVR